MGALRDGYDSAKSSSATNGRSRNATHWRQIGPRAAVRFAGLNSLQRFSARRDSWRMMDFPKLSASAVLSRHRRRCFSGCDGCGKSGSAGGGKSGDVRTQNVAGNWSPMMPRKRKAPLRSQAVEEARRTLHNSPSMKEPRANHKSSDGEQNSKQSPLPSCRSAHDLRPTVRAQMCSCWHLRCAVWTDQRLHPRKIAAFVAGWELFSLPIQPAAVIKIFVTLQASAFV